MTEAQDRARAKIKAGWAANDRQREARRQRREAERAEIGRTEKGCGFDGGCDNPHYAQGLCHPHYDQHHRGYPLTPLQDHRGKPCTFGGCDEPNYAKGLCKSHAAQRYRGNPLTPIRQRTP